MSTPTDSVSFTGLTGNSPVFALKGGNYLLIASGTLTGVQLSIENVDGFQLIGTKVAAAGTSQLGFLPAGQYQLAVTATSANVSVAGCPTS
jgi:hypothetical protein